MCGLRGPTISFQSLKVKSHYETASDCETNFPKRIRSYNGRAQQLGLSVIEGKENYI